MSERIENLRTAIETMHGCKATHERSAVTVEKFKNQIAREGVVESFALTGHPKAKRCHAWSHQDNGQTQRVNVLEIPPVVSAQTAVQAAIASGSQK
ncbi:MAG: hypothetical protein KGR98_12495 [Verrucomicrobia bacterium]|nr:hypothetical protein [Verrucomicrobiota bacterium]MDE3100567.1 hypothetical protein [Verrucomicrobiota bacterium]